MAAATLSAIRLGLKANLETITGVQVSAYLDANPTPPAIEVTLEDDTEYLTMGRATIEWKFLVRAYVGMAVEQQAQVLLDLLMESAGASSVRAAIESDKTLGGAAQDVAVSGMRAPRIYSRAGGPEYLGAEWAVDVLAAGV